MFATGAQRSEVSRWFLLSRGPLSQRANSL